MFNSELKVQNLAQELANIENGLIIRLESLNTRERAELSKRVENVQREIMPYVGYAPFAEEIAGKCLELRSSIVLAEPKVEKSAKQRRAEYISAGEDSQGYDVPWLEKLL
jgi:hypothetical protein